MGGSTFDFIDGTHVLREHAPCRGCWMLSHWDDLSDYLRPVWEDEGIFVVQDAAIPLPGLYVIGVKAHLSSIDNLPDQLLASLSVTISRVRAAMRNQLGIERVILVQEEVAGTNSHLHACLVPLPDSNFKIFRDNLAPYLETFASDSSSVERIRALNHLLALALSEVGTTYE